MTCNNGKIQFQINCLSRGFHIYRNIWSLKIEQNLVGEMTTTRSQISFGANISKQLSTFDIVEHISREVSLFFHYIVNYARFIEARVRESKYKPSHCVKSVQMRSFFWSVFSRIRAEYEEKRIISPYSIQMRENTDQNKLCIWILFTH